MPSTESTKISSCTLCSGKGCLVTLFGQKQSRQQSLSSKLMILIYGIPLGGFFVGALLGALFSELASILGAGIGLFCAFACLRVLQKGLLCWHLGQPSGEN